LTGVYSTVMDVIAWISDHIMHGRSIKAWWFTTHFSRLLLNRESAIWHWNSSLLLIAGCCVVTGKH